MDDSKSYSLYHPYQFGLHSFTLNLLALKYTQRNIKLISLFTSLVFNKYTHVKKAAVYFDYI